jgi:hypothetical protein
MLLFERWAYPLGTLAGGSSRSVGTDTAPRSLSSLLTRRTVRDSKDVTSPWDPRSYDMPRIMQMIMFHESAGGRNYTKLAHAYEGYLDLSDHLHARRAILVGQVKVPGSHLHRNGKVLAPNSRQWAFCRLVLPVETGSKGTAK